MAAASVSALLAVRWRSIEDRHKTIHPVGDTNRYLGPVRALDRAREWHRPCPPYLWKLLEMLQAVGNPRHGVFDVASGFVLRRHRHLSRYVPRPASCASPRRDPTVGWKASNVPVCVDGRLRVGSQESKQRRRGRGKEDGWRFDREKSGYCAKRNSQCRFRKRVSFDQQLHHVLPGTVPDKPADFHPSATTGTVWPCGNRW